MKTADVVIVGAGANGASTAFHLAKAGVKRVVVVERRHIGAGATGKSGALVRTHYTNESETRLAVESLKYFENWRDMVGGECGFQQVGMLVFTPRDYRSHLEANVAMQRDCGADANVISRAQALEIDPALQLDDVDVVAWEPRSGFADPNATAFSFARAAQAMGVELLVDTEVTAVTTEGNKVTGVMTSAGPIQAPVVLIAAGAWANKLFAPLGVDLGLVANLARVTIFRWAYDRPPTHRTYIDRINHTWIRPIDGNCTLIGAESGVRQSDNPDSFAEHVTQDYIEKCRQEVTRRFPVMRHATVRGNWVGMWMRSPDARPIIDQLKPYDGLFTFTGDSGTSFKTSPAIGKCLAEWITEGRAKTVDLHPFRATRFAEGKPWVDEFDYGSTSATISR